MPLSLGVVFICYLFVNEIGVIALDLVSPVPALFWELESLESGAMAESLGEIT